MVLVSRKPLQSLQAHMLDKESFSSASAAVDALNRGRFQNGKILTATPKKLSFLFQCSIGIYSWPCLEMNLAFQFHWLKKMDVSENSGIQFFPLKTIHFGIPLFLETSKWCWPGLLKLPDDFVVVFSGSSGGRGVSWAKELLRRHQEWPKPWWFFGVFVGVMLNQFYIYIYVYIYMCIHRGIMIWYTKQLKSIWTNPVPWKVTRDFVSHWSRWASRKHLKFQLQQAFRWTLSRKFGTSLCWLWLDCI